MSTQGTTEFLSIKNVEKLQSLGQFSEPHLRRDDQESTWWLLLKLVVKFTSIERTNLQQFYRNAVFSGDHASHIAAKCYCFTPHDYRFKKHLNGLSGKDEDDEDWSSRDMRFIQAFRKVMRDGYDNEIYEDIEYDVLIKTLEEALSEMGIEWDYEVSAAVFKGTLGVL